MSTSVFPAARIARPALGSLLLLSLTACTDPLGSGNDRSRFTAVLSGALNATVSGSATAASGDAWTRQVNYSLTAPTGDQIAGVLLSTEDRVHTISIGKHGTTLEAGTFKVAGIGGQSPFPPGAFTAAYTRRAGQRLTIFTADSGSVEFFPTGEHVAGLYTLYFTNYDVVELPTGPMSSNPVILRVIERGSAPLRIQGDFDAPPMRRR